MLENHCSNLTKRSTAVWLFCFRPDENEESLSIYITSDLMTIGAPRPFTKPSNTARINNVTRSTMMGKYRLPYSVSRSGPNMLIEMSTLRSLRRDTCFNAVRTWRMILLAHGTASHRFSQPYLGTRIGVSPMSHEFRDAKENAYAQTLLAAWAVKLMLVELQKNSVIYCWLRDKQRPSHTQTTSTLSTANKYQPNCSLEVFQLLILQLYMELTQTQWLFWSAYFLFYLIITI